MAALPIFSRSFRNLVSISGEGHLLDHLLVAALDRAIALAQVDDVALVSPQDLELDVVGVLDVLLDVYPELPKAFSASARGVITLDAARTVVVGDAHAAAAAAGTALIMTG